MAREKVEQEILRLEERYWKAIQDRDFDTAVRLTDEPCIVSGASGVARIERPKFLEMMHQATYTLRDFRLRDAQVRLLGDDVAIVAYNVHEELILDGKPLSLDAADASTWIRRPDGWVCALHTEAVIGDPFGRGGEASRRSEA